MNLKSAAFGYFPTRLRKKLLFAIILINLLTPQLYAQTDFTRNQFARLSVLTRARYFENEILKAATKQGVDPNILWTICYLETRFQPFLTSPKNAQGLMQFIPATAARFDLSNPYEPISAIGAAARYVRVLSNLFGGRLDSILAAYNSGEGTVSAFSTGRTLRSGKKLINPKGRRTIGGVPPYAETVNYVGRGLKIYRWLISRGTYPSNIAGTVFPTVISEAVARVRLKDYEIGKIPDFKAPVYIPQTVARVPAGTEIITDTTAPNSEQTRQKTDLTEIYYDSRSGNRYLVENGIKTKLKENGVVVITLNSRPAPTNKARSTFFAAPSK